MKLNRFETNFKAAIDELAMINGRCSVITNMVTQEKKRIQNDPLIGEDLADVGLSFRDITLQIGVDNLFLPDNFYNLRMSSLAEEVDLILSRTCLFQVSQAYEVLESYLYNQVAEFVVVSQPKNMPEDYTPKTNTYVEIRKALKRLHNRSNNVHLLAILRNNIDKFKENEVNNIYNLDFGKWYDVLSEVRHATTHSRTKVTTKLKERLKYKQNESFKIVADGDSEVILLSVSECMAVLGRIAEFIFFIHITVSEACYDEKINFKTIQHIYNDPYNK